MHPTVARALASTIKRTPRSAVGSGVEKFPLRPNRVRSIAAVGLGLAWAWVVAGEANAELAGSKVDARATTAFLCEDGATLAGGEPDRAILAREASNGIRASWCERYDESGTAIRIGTYREYYPSGSPRTQSQYRDGSLAGPVEVYDEDGGLFLRGFLVQGEWTGRFEIFHAGGAVWFEAHFQSGRLEGPLRTRYPDGTLESETRYQAGREDGLARSFYPTKAGGRLKSEAHVEANQIVGLHRVLDRSGELTRSIDWNEAPPDWRAPRQKPLFPDPKLTLHD